MDLVNYIYAAKYRLKLYKFVLKWISGQRWKISEQKKG